MIRMHVPVLILGLSLLFHSIASAQTVEFVVRRDRQTEPTQVLAAIGTPERKTLFEPARGEILTPSSAEVGRLRRATQEEIVHALPAFASAGEAGRRILHSVVADHRQTHKLRQTTCDILVEAATRATRSDRLLEMLDLVIAGHELDTTAAVHVVCRALSSREGAAPLPKRILAKIDEAAEQMTDDNCTKIASVMASDPKMYREALLGIATNTALSPLTRRIALLGVSAAPGGEVDQALRDLLNDEDTTVAATAAAMAIKRGGRHGRVPLLTCLQNLETVEDRETAARAARALLALGDRRCIGAVVDFYESTFVFPREREGTLARRRLKVEIEALIGDALPAGDVPRGLLASWWQAHGHRYPPQIHAVTVAAF